MVNFGSRFLYNHWFSYSTSIILAYLNGMIIAFILAKLLVFTSSQQTLHRSVLFFVLINLLAVLQTWLVSMGLNYYLFPKVGMHYYPDVLAHAIGIIIPVFSSYLGHKYLSFR